MTARRTASILALSVTALLAGCVAPSREAPPVALPTPVPVPVPVPPPPPPPPPTPNLSWADASLSPGNWTWRGREALFGPPGAPSFVVRCEGNRRVSLTRVGAAGATSLAFRASNGNRAVNAEAGAGGLVATVDAGDPMLDILLFSRGRFAVEAAGSPRLIVPAWPEPARVVDDCRR